MLYSGLIRFRQIMSDPIPRKPSVRLIERTHPIEGVLNVFLTPVGYHHAVMNNNNE